MIKGLFASEFVYLDVPLLLGKSTAHASHHSTLELFWFWLTFIFPFVLDLDHDSSWIKERDCKRLFVAEAVTGRLFPG